MPHQCTDCGRSFCDGSTEMLSGCPDCGGTTFQYIPEEADSEPPAAEPPDPPEAPADSSVARTVGTAATAVRDFVGGSPGGPADPDAEHPDAGQPAGDTPQEDPAQASARNEVVSPEELPAGAGSSVTDRPTPVLDEDSESVHSSPPARRDESGHDRPDLQTLREELNDQFESIKVVEPGQYELNLMELYDREEYIIALQEDGKYTIQVPERWTGE